MPCSRARLHPFFGFFLLPFVKVGSTRPDLRDKGNSLVQVNTKSLQKIVLDTASNPEGKWLFGSLTCPLDELGVDKMFPHQVHQSASRFDHRVLYVSNSTGRATSQQMRSHAAILSRLNSMQMADELINIDELNFLDLARHSMDDKTAEAFVSLKYPDYNKAMVAFLEKCREGYDHCAWLDGDIFVHRGSIPWVDEAVQRHFMDEQIIIGKPSFLPSEGDAPVGFGSRYFIYHTEGLKRLLPLRGKATDTFETLVKHNVEKVLKVDGSVFRSGHNSGSWVIHPPDDGSDMHRILRACEPEGQGLNAVLAIVEEGSENGEPASSWRDRKDYDLMDTSMWSSHIHHNCSGQRLIGS